MNHYNPHQQVYYPNQPYEFLYARGMPTSSPQHIGPFVNGVRHQINLLNGIPQEGGYPTTTNYVHHSLPPQPQYVQVDHQRISITEKGINNNQKFQSMKLK